MVLLVECKTVATPTAPVAAQDELQKYISEMFSAGWKLDKYSTSAIDAAAAAASEAIPGSANVIVYHSFIWLKEATDEDSSSSEHAPGDRLLRGITAGL